jgi:hypothetical protein
MNRAALAAAASAAGALALAAAFAGGYALATGHTVALTRTRVITRTLPGPTLTEIRTVYRARHHKKPPTAPASPAAPAVAFGCKILQTGPGQEQFNVTTSGGATYSGTVYVSFYDYPGSGATFPPTTVHGATPVGSWQPVPAADIGASAEPAGCIASAG